MSGIIQFVNSIIDAVVSLFEFVGKGISYLMVIVNALPAVIIGPVVAGIAILVIFLLLGRGS